MKLYDTLSGEKKELESPKDKPLRIFVCGPTVYDHSHIGHARTYIAFDMFIKYLRQRLGYEVFYLQNITDIDDKIINKSQEEGRTAKEVAKEYTEKYFEDMEALKIDSVDKYAPASEYIDEIIKQVELLISNDYAYQTKNGIYFRVGNFKDYGKLSGQKQEEMAEAVNIEEDSLKEDPRDFVVWKAAKEGEPQWDSPWGPGRPGWHIEDTALAEKEFKSPQYELHGGARDLIFPHHEAEIALMEAAYGLKPMVNYWLHTGFLQVNSEKMSKSLKNFITIRDALKTVSPNALRIFFTTKHYRSPIDYSKEGLQEAMANEKRLTEFWANIISIETEEKEQDKKIEKHINSFWLNLEDDFNTPQAFAKLFSLVSYVYKAGSLAKEDKDSLTSFMENMNSIFNIVDKDNLKVDVPEEVKKLAEERESARENKKWEEADRFREEIEKRGYAVRDTDEGPEIRRL